jgi:hypothetical protein
MQSRFDWRAATADLFPAERPTECPAGEQLVPRAGRGVYWARAQNAGRPVAYAVTAAGDELTRLTVMSTMKRDQVLGALWDLLDELDPIEPPTEGA